MRLAAKTRRPSAVTVFATTSALGMRAFLHEGWSCAISALCLKEIAHDQPTFIPSSTARCLRRRACDGESGLRRADSRHGASRSGAARGREPVLAAEREAPVRPAEDARELLRTRAR